jgi:hypothetical protein
MKLDRTRDFGVICGGDDGACYVQDEILFDAAGNAITDVAPEPKKRMGRPPKVRAEDIDINLDDQIDANLNNE